MKCGHSPLAFAIAAYAVILGANLAPAVADWRETKATLSKRCVVGSRRKSSGRRGGSWKRRRRGRRKR